jgi:hypothetical protein
VNPRNDLFLLSRSRIPRSILRLPFKIRQPAGLLSFTQHDINPGLVFPRESAALTSASLATSSDVKVLDFERVLFNELAARLDIVAH